MISIVGNICDNAIEHLSSLPEDKRRMQLEIKVYRDYDCVTCKNIILTSVLAENPELRSAKKDGTLHGKGIGLLKQTAEKYQGEVVFSEEQGWFIASVIILKQN